MGIEQLMGLAVGVEKIAPRLCERAQVVLFEEVDSTNNYAMRTDFNSSAIVISKSQSSGKGRLDRRFESPIGGLYMSIVRFEKCGFSAGELTAAAAVAVVRALKKVFDVESSIKWVNDIFINNKKVCGILCESVAYGNNVKTVVGIGVNLTCNSAIPDCAAAVVEHCSEDTRHNLAVEIYNNYVSLRENGGFFEEYRDNCFVLGKNIEVRCTGEEPYLAKAVELNNDYSLTVLTQDGAHVLRFGEVSLRAISHG